MLALRYLYIPRVGTAGTFSCLSRTQPGEGGQQRADFHSRARLCRRVACRAPRHRECAQQASILDEICCVLYVQVRATTL